MCGRKDLQGCRAWSGIAKVILLPGQAKEPPLEAALERDFSARCMATEKARKTPTTAGPFSYVKTAHTPHAAHFTPDAGCCSHGF